MMKRDDALVILSKYVQDGDIVVAVYQALFDWLHLCPRRLNYVSTGAMGQASSHGLGLALANPDRRVIVFDGDGSLLMNLGSLATIVDAGPKNFRHLVFVNGMYEVNGEHPVPGRDRIDFGAIARACGFTETDHFESISELSDRIGHFLDRDGPSFAALKVVPGKKYERNYPYIHSKEVRHNFRLALNEPKD